MAKRVYQPKEQPLAVQLQIAEAIVLQNENVIREAEEYGRAAAKAGHANEIRKAAALLESGREGLATAIARRDALRSQISA